MAGKYPRAGYIEIYASGPLTGLCDPVAALQVEFLYLHAAVASRFYTHIQYNVALGPDHAFFCLTFTLPATGRAAERHKFVSLESRLTHLQRFSQWRIGPQQ